MSVAGPSQDANCSPSGGSAAAPAASVGATVSTSDWTLTRDADGIAWLTFDCAGATTNTLSKAALAELNGVLDALDAEPPRGLVIRSGKPNGFIAGADIDEFDAIHDAAGVQAIVTRGLETFDRLASARYPTLALIRGYLPRRRPRARARMPLSRRRRRSVARASACPR